MANATNIRVADYRDGAVYHAFTALSSDAWTAIAGYGYNSQNWVTAIKFQVAAPASSVTFSWIAWNSEGGFRDLKFVITEGESATYINATSATPGDGTFTAESGQYFRTTLTASKNLKANTDYVLYIWTNRSTAYNSFTSIRVWNASTYPMTVTYTAAASYTLSLSAGSNVTASVTLNSSPFGRSGNVVNNGTIYAGEVLRLTYSVSTGYAIATHTLNESSVNSGATHTVAGNVTIVLTASASTSTISTGNGTFGTAQTITVTRYNSAYTHTIVATCAGQTQQIATKSSSLSISWTPALSIMNSITNAMSASCVLTCETFSGSTSLGTTTITVTLSLPAALVKPTPSLSVSDAMGYASTYGGYVQGYSKMAVTVTDGLKYSATTASRSTTANGTAYSAASFTTGAVTGSGTVSTTVKDSRGQTGAASTSVTVLPYSAPGINAFGVHRCDSDGTANDEGNYFKVSYDVAVTSLNNANSKTLQFRYRQVGGAWSGWTSIAMSSYTQSGFSSAVDISAGLALGTSYEVEISLADDFSTVTRSTTLSTVAVTMDLNEFGDGVAFGKVSTVRQTLDIGDWSAIGRVMGLGQARAQLTSGAYLNSYTNFGVYGIPDGIALNDTPSGWSSAGGGRLIVANAVGSTRQPGEINQTVLQELIHRSGTRWVRYGGSGTGTTVSWDAWQPKDSTVSFGNTASYDKLPDGTLIQWGVYTWSGSGTMSQINATGIYTTPISSISLATPFYNNAYSVSASSRYATGNILPCGAIPSSTSAFTVEAYDFYGRSLSDGKLLVYWKAVGRWK